MKAELARWEAILESEGLGVATSGDFGMVRARAEVSDPAVDAWKAWAAKVLAEHAFLTDIHRAVWTMYADGKSYSDIQSRLNIKHRGTVGFIVAHVESHTSLEKPCGNPWAKRRATIHSRKRPFSESLKRWRDQQKEPRMPPKDMGQVYERVQFRRGEGIKLPGRAVENDSLTNVRARRMPDGMEFLSLYDKHAKAEVPFASVIYVPSWRIAQAERAQDEA